MRVRHLALLISLFTFAALHAQLTVEDASTPTQLVEDVLLGGGISASNISATGATSSRGSFTANGSNLGLGSGVILCTGDVTTVGGAGSDDVWPNMSGGSDNDLVQLSGQAIYSASILEFDFIPSGDSLHFKFVFGSEEYPWFACSQFNDAFGFFISGPGISGPFSNNSANIALVPSTTIPITINTINSGTAGIAGAPSTCAAADPNWQSNSIYYVDNENGTTVAFNGFTTVLTALAQVQCGQTYHIKLAIGNGTDGSLQSGVFLGAGSFAVAGQVIPSLTTGIPDVGANDSTMFEGCGTVPLHFRRTGDPSNADTVQVLAGGTATPGVDYYPPIPSEIIFQPGDTAFDLSLTVPLDADGLETLTLQITRSMLCSGMDLVNNYTFYIDQYPPLDVVTQNVNGQCGQSYVLSPEVSSGLGSYGYLWSTGETTSAITVSVDTTTTFYVTVSDTCGVQPVQDSITVIIPYDPPLVLTVSPDISIPCMGTDTISVVSLTGGTGEYGYSWSQGGTILDTTTILAVPSGDPVYYVMTVSEGCGHTVSDSVLVSTVPLPHIAIGSWDSTVFCIGDTVVLRPNSVTGGNGVYTYAWLNDTGAVVGNTNTLLVGVPADSSYTLQVTDQCGYATDSVFTTLIPRYAPFILQMPADTTICTGDQVTLVAKVDGGSGVYTLNWEGLGWTDPSFTYAGDQDKTFVVDVIDRCGAHLSDTAKVTVQHPVSTILIANQGEDDWLFQATTIPFTVPVMIWDLGDGTIVKATSTTHSYLDLEDHWVTLRTVSEEGCPAEDSLLVKAPATLYFPNAFTPDGDGFNDTFGPKGISIERFSMEIYDRWGHLVYSTTSMDQPWDGKVNGGADASTGVYVYHYSAKGHYFEARQGYGHVTLLRGSPGAG